MDFKPDNSKLKSEKSEILEVHENDLDFWFEVHVKVEKHLDWDSIQSVLARNRYKRNISHDQEGYMEKIPCDFNECHDSVEQETSVQNIISNVVYDTFVKIETHENIISYDELKEYSMQRCILCGQHFSNSYSLLQHNLIHFKVPLINRKVFMCEHCPKYYKKKSHLESHIHSNHYRRIITTNNKIPITKREHKCLICNKTYSYKTWFSHMTEVHCENKFKCEKCGLSFKAKRYLKRHNLVIHEKVKRETINDSSGVTKCPKCPAKLDSKSALTTHLRNCHSNEKFTCHLCKSTLKCKSYLLTHLRRVHYNDGLLHQCDMCSKIFKSQRYLKIHIKNAHIKKEKS